MEQEPLVCGVPVSQAERFLSLIRVGYPMTELATSFLEERAGIRNVQGIANVRDALSHLATFLDPSLDSEERENQISYAEEHLRRAIIEPYQVAVEDLISKFQQLYEKYREQVLPVMDRYDGLRSAPNAIQIDAVLRDIAVHMQTARMAKGRNRWDEEWEKGITHFTLAFDKATRLQSQIEEYWNRYEQIGRDAHQTSLARTSIKTTVVTAILGAILGAVLGVALTKFVSSTQSTTMISPQTQAPK